MTVGAKQERVVAAGAEHMAEVVVTTLTRKGWSGPFVNERLRQVTARDNRSDTQMRATWRFEYDLRVRWEVQEGGCLVLVEVTERKNNWTQAECEKRCQEVLEGIGEDAQIMASVLGSQKAPDSYGSARWADGKEFASAGYIGKAGAPGGLLIGPSSGGGAIVISPADTAKHAIVCGPTGSGKTSSIFIPNLIERVSESAIVTEATAGNELPDLFKTTSGYRKRAGQEIYYFNPDDLRSNQINPIDVIEKIDQAQNVANLIIENTNKRGFTGGDPIWETSERHLLTALLMHAAAERSNLALVRGFLRQGPQALGALLQQSKSVDAKEEYLAFYKNSTDGFRNGVTSGLLQRLNLWVNPKIVKLTEKTDFEIDKLGERPFTFYFAVPAQKTHLKPLAALVFNFILELALEKQFKCPLFLSLDEFTNFGYIPAIAEKLTIIRHRNIPALLGIQDYVQLEKVYGPQDATLLFSQPGTKVFFRPRDLKTGKKVSEMLGSRTVNERKVSSSGQIHEREFGRPLLNAGEVMAMPDRQMIVFTPATAPGMVSRYGWQEYEGKTAGEPELREALEIEDSIVRGCAEAKSPPEWDKLEVGAEDSRLQSKGREERKNKPADKDDKGKERAKRRNDEILPPPI